jgi:hypothetical protein
MTLAERLDQVREAGKARLGPERRQVMERAVEDLRTSGAVDRAVKIGAKAPDFTGRSAAGRLVKLSELLARGPVVLSFFRGRW